MLSPTRSPKTWTLLASSRAAGGWDVAGVPPVDGGRRGAVATRPRPSVVRRAEPGPAGALLLEARGVGGELVCEVWGEAATPPETAAAALAATAAWVGANDCLEDAVALSAVHPVTARLAREVGLPRLGALPRVVEALGRAVVNQLVQGVEAARSCREIAASVGQPAPGGLWAWPSARTVGATPLWTLRRCGISGRMVSALHAGAVEEPRLEHCRDDWPRLDARLRAIPGVGWWTSAETRLALGDPDAVSVGDYHLPSIVGTVLTGRARPRAAWSDEEMLALLAPFSGQRGRIIRLCERATAVGAAPRPARRAPRAALSAHRYW